MASRASPVRKPLDLHLRYDHQWPTRQKGVDDGFEEKATLRRSEGNVKETALVLGIDRSTLYDKLKTYRIERT